MKTAARVAYLGPSGTFTEAAARSMRTAQVGEFVAMNDATEIAAAVESGAIEFGVVPIENSVHGTVVPTLDELVFTRESVLVREEIIVDVTFTLFRNPESTAVATTVLSHPAGLQQCRGEIDRRKLTAIETSSTAEACRIVGSEQRDALCIAAPHAGKEYGLVPVAEMVQDRDGGRTRFYVLSQQLAQHDVGVDEFHTALVLTPARDRPGILLDMLRPFAERGLNLSSLMSRPLRSGLGLYCFIVTVDAHIDAPRFGAAISELLDAGVRVKNLGSYLAWPAAEQILGAHGEYPAGSVAASDPETAHRRVLAPPRDQRL